MLHVDVNVYGNPESIQYGSTLQSLQNNGVAYHFRDANTDEAARSRIFGLGYSLSVPVVVEIIGDLDEEILSETIWSGFRPDLIAELGKIMVIVN